MSMTKLSVYISYLLRHQPESIGLAMDNHGWVSVAELIAKINAAGRYHITESVLDEIVRTDNEGHFCYNEDATKIKVCCCIFSGSRPFGNTRWWLAGDTLYVACKGELGPIWDDPFEDIDTDYVEHVVIDSVCTSIELYTFAFWQNLKKVTIHEGVRKIGDYAFSNCKALTSITLPNSVEEIGRCAFKSCGNLKEIIIPDGVRKIGSGAFYRCETLTNIVLPVSVRVIGSEAFSRCIRLTSMQIPEGIRIIERGTFCGCIALTNIVLPASVQEIRYNAFCGSGLKSIVIPDSVEIIEDCAFNDCKNMTSIIIPHQVIKRGDVLYYADSNGVVRSWIITAASGSCGENLSWRRNGNTLHFEGIGAGKSGLSGYPLSNYINDIERDFADSVEAFENHATIPCAGLTDIAFLEKAIEIGDAFCFTGLSEKNYPWLITTLTPLWKKNLGQVFELEVIDDLDLERDEYIICRYGRGNIV